MVLKLSATAATAMRIMKDEKLFLLLNAILRTMNNSKFTWRVYGLRFKVGCLKFKLNVCGNE